ncbi:flavin reductase family protein [Devosia rhizoryzae]|uniref:Flavin reductase family protein n=1 Tax=Devosia rhizoryzae TaxID=2774137 RepID=A0ABX7CB47_9HYPH|nr:flavin reductase family protein [Devosia rhizoryzae]QQR41023.1 flavin reductase family protein [Devosia rhizoryzae]
MNAMTPEFELPDSMALRPLRRPAISDGEFRAAMAGLASSVHVVTARRGDERVGRTATSVISLSNQPPTILVSIDIVSRLADIIARTGGFSIALLSNEQAAIADAFAGKLDAPDRFSLGHWGNWPSGQPQLHGAVTALDCEVIGAMETGTHVLYAGAIIEAETHTARAPLIWHQRQYGSVGSIG